jgi:hypothetical protein
VEAWVPGTPDLDALASRREVTVVLRLVIGSGNRLLYGQVVDVIDGPQPGFRGWAGLTQGLRRWLSATGTRIPEGDDWNSTAHPQEKPT